MKKCVIVGVTSSIAAYKSAQLVSDLLKKGYDVEVIMSKNACEFISPLTFSSLTKHKTYVDTFDRNVNYDIEHISLAKKADCFIIAPASANIIAKVANGLADDMLSTVFLAFNGPKIIAPAMNSNMFLNPVTQDNLKKCEHYGIDIINPTSGKLACGDNGIGKLADIDELINQIEYSLCDKPLKGKKVLISAGPTIEKIDPVRYITNHSSGKQGYALAKAAYNLGADVTLVSGPVTLKALNGVKTIYINSAQEMFEAIISNYKDADIIIKAAAVADYTPVHYYDEKVKKHDDDMTIELKRTNDILKYLGEHKTESQTLVGFAMETQNLIENAHQKLTHKNCDMIVANSIRQAGAGFKGDTNVATLITKSGNEQLELMSKDKLAYYILNKIIRK